MAVSFHCPTDIPARDIRDFINDPNEKKWKGPFTFIQATDCQFGMIGSYKLGKDKPCWEIEVQLAKQTVNNINKMKPKPKFLVITGDMLDAYPFLEPPQYYKQSEKLDKELRELQYEAFVQVFRKLDPTIKLICTCGNHDVGERPTKESMLMYYKQFGSDYFSFWVGGIKFVVLNSQLFFSSQSLVQQLEEQNTFIDDIKDPNAKFIVVFQHVPFFINDVTEDDGYNNIPKHIRLPLLDRLNDAGVRYVFSGHTHTSLNFTYKNIELTVTSALGAPMGTTPSGYRIVNVNDTGLTHEYVQLKDSTEFDDTETEIHNDKQKITCCSKCNIVYTGLKIKIIYFTSAYNTKIITTEQSARMHFPHRLLHINARMWWKESFVSLPVSSCIA